MKRFKVDYGKAPKTDKWGHFLPKDQQPPTYSEYFETLDEAMKFASKIHTKKVGARKINEVSEINIFKDDNNVIHLKKPSLEYSFKEKVILVAGGKDKGISYESLGPVINDRVKLLILCGATAGVIRQSTEQAPNYEGLEIVDVADYHQAVALADSRAQEGDVVILSPASTSFDRFANFMERGRVFKDIVNALK